MSVGIALLAIEAGFRLIYHEFSCLNFVAERYDLLRSSYPTAYDSDLGWIPKEGRTSGDNAWKTSVTIEKDGIRSNDTVSAPVNPKKTILAVGDSFTFGDEVNDSETWPAQLEQISGSRVINGGVFGYGLDQTFLRMLKLSAQYRPDVIILSLIPDDIERCNLSERTSVPKPYFTVENGGLKLNAAHIAEPPARNRLNLPRRILGYSFAAHTLFGKIWPEYWLQGKQWKSTTAHADGEIVSCFLMREFASYVNYQGITGIVLIQWPKYYWDKETARIDQLIRCVDRRQLTLIDLRNQIQINDGPQRKANMDLFGLAHLNAQGNMMVAQTIQNAMQENDQTHQSPIPSQQLQHQ